MSARSSASSRLPAASEDSGRRLTKPEAVDEALDDRSVRRVDVVGGDRTSSMVLRRLSRPSSSLSAWASASGSRSP